MSKTGTLEKMKTELIDGTAVYQLPLSNDLIPLNDLIGKNLSLTFTGNIFDIHDGKKIKKSYGGGYSYKNFISLAQCDTCIIKPELCHYDQGTCREPEWAKGHCHKPHIIYLSNTGAAKIGITRKSQVPTRWIDQGANYALPILEVPDRKTSGLIESEISKIMSDKTNWRKMLMEESDYIDLYEIRENLFSQFGDLLDDLEAIDIDQDIVEIKYPIKRYPEKVKSVGFDKMKEVSGTLEGIKGQYLIFHDKVINIRKHAGYEIEFRSE